MNQNFVIAMDVGGSSVKSAIVSGAGEILDGSLRMTPIDSKGTRERIVRTFLRPVELAMDLARNRHIAIQGISIGVPGPFDYEKGISLIRGVDKYESIYGLDLKIEFKRRLRVSDHFTLAFENDAWCFVRGELWKGAGKGFKRIIGLTMGTGLGSGFAVDGRIIGTGAGIPPLAWIGGLPFQNGIIDDRISRRGIIARYRQLSTTAPAEIDVMEIATRAESGDASAIEVFEETGTILGKTLFGVTREFRADCIIIGGGIARSYHLFSSFLKHELEELPVTILKATHIGRSALLGAAGFLFDRLTI